MKILKVIPLLIALTIIFGNSAANAQACGQGVFSLEIYTLHGEKEQDINYEIFAINRDSLEAVFSQGRDLDKIIYSSFYGSIVQTKNALRIIDTTKSGQRELDNIFNLHLHKDDKPVGKIENSQVHFNTLELSYNLFLLKLNSNNREVYVIANFFGGCNRTSALLWNERPKIVWK
jgi:hypothetical protein